ncbi:MAG TPA: F0F1 ATP synthase subunit epsilon [Verrucomicrobiales bacterium]|nr:F0F1 ATP synthase subunit epsilon [Verrucomicrobiales bacterium]
MPLKLEIVTPEKKIFSDEVETVVIPGTEGEMGILPMHAPLVTTLIPGELRYVKDGAEMELAVGEGFVEVTQQRVAVLTDMAVSDEQIDEAAVEDALKRAEEALQEKTTAEEVAAVQASIQKSLAQLHLKRKRRRL